MVNLLIYLAVALLIIALAQLVRLSEVSAALKGSKENEHNYKDYRVNARLLFLFLGAFLSFCLWCVLKYKDAILPQAASEHGKGIASLMWLNMSLITVVFIGVNILLFYFAYKYHSRPETKATYYAHDNKLEMIWTIVPAAVLCVIIILGLRMWNTITEPAQKDAIVVELYAKQFDWTARYAGKDNILGHSNYKLIEGANALGLDSLDPRGADDIVVHNEIHIPVGKQVEFKIHSRDVIHSAFMPHFRVQMNAVPGMTTSMHFTPLYTTAEMRKKEDVIKQNALINAARAKKGEEPYEFNYVLLCNKICGASHYNMQLTIVVDTPADYAAWLAKQKPFFAQK